MHVLALWLGYGASSACTCVNTAYLDRLLTLRYSRVLLAWFVDLDCVILQVEEYDTVTDAVLFLSLLMNRLLEIGIESQNLES